ncbi:MAG TPA: hypothetical protein VHE30_12650 [Polyangiaceae bacterium]|nr:hypothetical protein [Polyangiaceae bacterium]
MRIRSDSEPAATLPPRPLSEVLTEIRGETGLDLAPARLRVGFARGHLLEVVVRHPEFGSADDERALDAANLLVRGLLGDSAFDVWIGAVDVAPAPRGGSLRVLPSGATPPAETSITPAELLPAVEAAVRSVDAALPAVPYPLALEAPPWTLLEAVPEPADDYAAQDDVALFSTALPEGIKSFLEGSPFSSRRFSRHGETFVYLKSDAGADAPEARHGRRVALEEALDGALRPSGLGCVVGAGLGIRYVYVALALVRFEEALRVASARLRELDVPRRSWFLFYDEARKEAFVPVWSDGPPPPR